MGKDTAVTVFERNQRRALCSNGHRSGHKPENHTSLLTISVFPVNLKLDSKPIRTGCSPILAFRLVLSRCFPADSVVANDYNPGTPLTFILIPVTLPTESVMNKSLLFRPAKVLLVAARAKGNCQDVVSIGVKTHHALSIADIDISQFIHRHAIASPFGKLAHVGERAVRIDVKDPRSTFAVVRPLVYVEFLSVRSPNNTVWPSIGVPIPWPLL